MFYSDLFSRLLFFPHIQRPPNGMMICGLKIQQSTSMHSKVGFRGFCTKTKQLCLSRLVDLDLTVLEACWSMECIQHAPDRQGSRPVILGGRRPVHWTTMVPWHRAELPQVSLISWHRDPLAPRGIAPSFRWSWSTAPRESGSVGAPASPTTIPAMSSGAHGARIVWMFVFMFFSVCHVSVSGK